MSNITGPDFITLLVSDLDASFHFYKDKIGLPVSSEKRSNAHAFLTKPCGMAIRLAPGRPRAEHANPGMIVWLHASDAGALYEELKQRGVPFVDELTLKPLPYGKTFSFRDPDGYVLSVYDGIEA